MVIGSMETSISISKLAMVTPGRILVCLRTVLETLLFDIGRFLVLIRFRATSLKLVFGRTEVDFFLDFFHLIAKSPHFLSLTLTMLGCLCSEQNLAFVCPGRL